MHRSLLVFQVEEITWYISIACFLFKTLRKKKRKITLSFLFQRPWLKAFSKALLVVRVKEFPPAKQLLKEIILFNLNIDRTLQWRILISYLSFNAIIQNNSKDVRVLYQILTFLFLMWFTYILHEHSFVNLSEKLLPAFHFSAFNWDPKARWAFCLKYSGKLLWLLDRAVGSSRNPRKESKIETLSFLAFYNISITMLVLGVCHNTEAHTHNVKIKNTHVYNVQTLRFSCPSLSIWQNMFPMLCCTVTASSHSVFSMGMPHPHKPSSSSFCHLLEGLVLYGDPTLLPTVQGCHTLLSP